MSERFGGEIYERAYRVERDPLFEAKKLLDEINRLMAKVVEQGDLSSQQKQLLRAQVQTHLAALGLTDLAQLVDFTASVYQGVRERVKNPRTPSDYPHLEEFRRNYTHLLREDPRSSLPGVWRDIIASEVSQFAQYDWQSVEGRGTDTISYHYALGRVMSDELAYTTVFDKPGDEIKITRNWLVDNGRHRALVLRTLGERYTRLSGMDMWVTAQRDPDLR